MARFLLFSLLSCTQDGGEEKIKKKVTHGVGGGGTQKCRLLRRPAHKTQQGPLYGIPSSLFLTAFFFFSGPLVVSACVMPSSQSQTNRCQGAPYISDGVERLFTLFFFLFSCVA